MTVLMVTKVDRASGIVMFAEALPTGEWKTDSLTYTANPPGECLAIGQQWEFDSVEDAIEMFDLITKNGYERDGTWLKRKATP